MLRSKQFNDIESALRFANDFENKIIPISFVDVTPGPNILLVYEPVEVPAPGTHEQDLIALLKRAHAVIDASYNPVLKQDIAKCLNSL